ncbi:hypothetical protein HU200_065648 [Digitaria exilis]|uniref:Protein COFACTOR ASSEMBLY OF COMPLEX C SUBUNIT B CCB3, chloroplastic n=1 Tax=Digitaria exilis TaxID=1010633 RepID=A0A835DXT3_9POAL|nr:hypothetical protein HU200_065648 [Digitaria exilis]CAB3475555.1 unnamed protein product [Digitaria exilis]
MEASLLAAPKPCIFSGRGPAAARRCLVVVAAAAAAARKEVGRNEDGRAQRTVKGVGAAAMMMIGGEIEPCHAASSLQAVAVLGDLDPATAKAVAGVAGPALSALGFLFILRIVMSWYPRLPVTEFPYVLAYAPTEPFLVVTRRIIPPLGGVDVTPVVWFGLVSFLNEILVGPQGLLVLLSQQQQL